MNIVQVLHKRNAVFACQAEHFSHVLLGQDIFPDEKILQSVEQMLHMYFMNNHIRIDTDQPSRLPQIIVCLRKLFSLHLQHAGNFCPPRRLETAIDKSFFHH